MSQTGLPFDDFRALLQRLPEPDGGAASSARQRLDGMTRQGGSLGRIGEIGVWLAGWRARAVPVVRPELALFAGTHGIDGAPAIETTKARIEWLAVGGAPAGALCQTADIGLKLYDLALDVPTADISRQAAFEERDCAATMAFGMEAIAGGADLFCIGAVEGGAIASAAILAALLGGEGADWTGDAAQAKAVDAALECHKGRLGDPLEVLRRLGGRETAAIAGAIVAARMERIPVVLEGRAALAAGAALQALEETALDHCLLAGVSEADAALASRLRLEPLLAFGIEAGEGISCVLAAQMVKSAAQLVAAPAVRA